MRKKRKGGNTEIAYYCITPAFTGDTSRTFSNTNMDVLKVWTCAVIVTLIILVGLGLVPWGTGLEIIMRLSEVLLKFEGIYFVLEAMGVGKGSYVQDLSMDI